MTPGIGVLVSERDRIVKMQYFFSSSCQYTWAWIRQIKYIVLVTKKVSTKIVNFMTYGAGFLMLGHDPISLHYLLLYQYTAHYWNCIKGL